VEVENDLRRLIVGAKRVIPALYCKVVPQTINESPPEYFNKLIEQLDNPNAVRDSLPGKFTR
jgi:hypothetical protein